MLFSSISPTNKRPPNGKLSRPQELQLSIRLRKNYKSVGFLRLLNRHVRIAARWSRQINHTKNKNRRHRNNLQCQANLGNKTSMRVLVVEDENKTAEYLQQGLSESGYIVDRASDGIDALHLFNHNAYGLVILDVNLPGIDGWGVLGSIRKTSQVRIMMLTGRGRLTDKIKGLDAGADDYLVKPFEFPEFLARVRSLLRRGEELVESATLQVANLELDPGRHRAYRGEHRIDLTTKEFALLHLLMSRTGEVLTRSQIISLVWDMNFDCDTNVIDVSIRRLRAKIDDPFETKLIHTLRGVGYVLEDRS